MAEKMTAVQFLKHPVYGCAEAKEIIQYSREDKAGFETLKEWAKQEMKNRGIEIEVPPPVNQ